MSITALIVAAGRGLRAGGDLPKQYRALNGRPVLAWTLEPFLVHLGGLSPTQRTKLAAPVHDGSRPRRSPRFVCPRSPHEPGPD